MNRVLLLCVLSFSGFCASIDEPEKLIEEWQACQRESTMSLECLHTKRNVITLHDYVDLLQRNPQQMGLDIMSVQIQLTKLQAQENPDPMRVKVLKDDLAGMLATVGWLESPK
jgi:hypothetical protein